MDLKPISEAPVGADVPAMTRSGASQTSHSGTEDTTPKYTCLYFGYGSNLSPRTMRQRCPDALYISLARLPDYKWIINSTGYANIIPSLGDEVYGTLCFLSNRDESALDESEGVPWMYEKHKLKMWRLPPGGGGEWGKDEEEVEATVYVDVQRLEEGKVEKEYIIWIQKAIADGLACGMPESYADKYLRQCLPTHDDGKTPFVPLDTIMIRTTRFGEDAKMVPKGFASWTRG